MASFAHGKQASSSGWGSLVLAFGAGGWPGPAHAHVTHMAKSDVPQRDSAVPQSFGTPPSPPHLSDTVKTVLEVDQQRVETEVLLKWRNCKK